MRQNTYLPYKNSYKEKMQFHLSICFILSKGLVVAVKDHEHFRLKLLYGRKKKIQNTLRETEVRLQIFKVCKK